MLLQYIRIVCLFFKYLLFIGFLFNSVNLFQIFSWTFKFNRNIKKNILVIFYNDVLYFVFFWYSDISFKDFILVINVTVTSVCVLWRVCVQCVFYTGAHITADGWFTHAWWTTVCDQPATLTTQDSIKLLNSYMEDN